MKRKTFEWTIILIALGSAIVINIDNLFMANQLKEIRRREAVSVGEFLSPITVVQFIPHADGSASYSEPELLDFNNSDGRSTVLLLFSPNCSFCASNLPLWAAIRKEIDSRKYRVVTLATTAASVYSPKNIVDKMIPYRKSLGDDVLVVENPKALRRNKLSTVPQTVIIDTDGRVERIWVGKISSRSAWKQITQALEI